MQETEFIWFDGKLIPWNKAKIHVLSHTLHYGGGAFEGIRFYETSKGPAIFRLKDHVLRLLYSAKALHMKLDYTEEEITDAIIQTVRVNKIKEGYIRPLIFYGYHKMGLNPIGNPVELVIACWPWGAYLAHESVNIKTSSYIRIHPDSTIVNAKLCGHYVNSMLASLELEGTSYDEALLLDDKGYISEGPGENIFFIKDNVLSTPQKGTILPGITRDSVIQFSEDLNLGLVETNITLEDAFNSEEAFFTGTAAEITPIHSIDDKAIGNGQCQVSKKIRSLYADIVRGKNEKYAHYLTWINDY